MNISMVAKAVGIVVLVLVSMFAASHAAAMVSAPNNMEVAAGLAIYMLLALIWVYVVLRIVKAVQTKLQAGEESRRAGHLMILIAVAIVAAVGCTRVDPGHVGIKVNYYGTDRGVDSLPLVTGRVWYNPVTETVFQYPTFVQTAIWTKDPHEGSPQNEEISFNTREGMVITGDISLSYQLDGKKVPAFYVKFRSDDLGTFTHGFLRNVARDAFNEVASRYAVDEVYGPKKEEFLATVRAKINGEVSVFGVTLQQFGFVGAPRLPQQVVDALNAKIKATQDAIRVENELRQAEAEAKKKVAAAEGDAKSNQILTNSITPTLLEWQRLQITKDAVSRWNGQLPQYNGGGAMPFIQLPGPTGNK